MINRMLVLSGILLLAGCNNSSAPPLDGPHLKTATYSTGELITYEYNKAGHITQISSNTNGQRKFSYSGNSAKEIIYNSQGTETKIIEYKLNGDGLISNEKTSMPESNKEKIYLYNTYKQVTSETTKDGENRETNVYYYTNDRLDSMEQRNNGNKLRQKQLYTYYPDIANTAFSLTDAIYMRGRQSPMAIKQANWIFYEKEGKEESHQTYSYTYETDVSKRITKAKINSAGNEIAAIAYTYY